MSRLPIASAASLLLLLAAASPAYAGAKAYKCVVDGKTTYQDHPCAGPAPVATVAAPAPAPVPARAQRAPVQLYDEIQMVERHQRELVAAYKAEEALAQPRMKALDPKTRQAEVRQLDARWLPRIRVQEQRLEGLRAELRSQCPGGASMRGGHFDCAH